MIENLDKLQSLSGLSQFQNLILNNIQNLLNQINLNNLNKNSQIEIKKNRIMISLVHKQDLETIVTLNILKDHATLWYSECDFYFDDYNNDFSVNNFIQIYRNSLKGNYETINYYLKQKLIFSSTIFIDSGAKPCIVPYNLLYKILFFFFKKYFTTKQIVYKSFI